MYKKLILLFISVLYFSSCDNRENVSDAYGNFEAVTLSVSSESNGRLLVFNVEEGQTIKAGTLVGLVDTTQLHLQRKQIEAGLNVLPKKLRNTLADIDVLQNQKSNLIRERDRVERLLSKKAATPKQLDDLNGQIDVLEKQILAIRAQTNTANQGILAEKEPLLAQIALLNEQIRRCYIYNPVDGTVLTKVVEAQEMVGMGSPLYRLGELDTMELRFYADAQQLQTVKLGQEIQVLIDQGETGFSELKGKVSWISPQSEFTPKTIQTKKDRVNLVYAVKAKVANPDGKLKIGMPAEVNFQAKSVAE